MRLGPAIWGLVLAAGSAHAAVPAVPGPRALGMANALRGAATGDAALSLNPSGISLLKWYVVEGSYMHARAAGEHDAHVSVVDSTSSYGIGGGIYYTYLAASPEGAPERSGHEGGAALSFPFGEKVTIGGTLKYLRLVSEGGGLPAEQVTKGFTFDAGLTVRPVPSFTVGVVGHNLGDKEDPRFPFAVGGGITVGLRDLLLSADGVLDFTTHDDMRGNVVHVMGAAEYQIAKGFALRAGGGRRGDTRAGFLSTGLSLFSEIGALDAGLQQDLGGSRKETFFALGARVFVPTASSQ